MYNTNINNPYELGNVDSSKTGLHPDLKAFNTYLVKMYGWTNNSRFYAIVPSQWRQYYIHNIQGWLEWSNGFSQTIHGTAGLIPTRMGSQVIQLLTNLVMSGGFHFDGAENDTSTRNALNFISNEWTAKKFDFNNFLYKTFSNSLSGGTTLVVANEANGDLWLESIRIDRYFVNVDARGTVRECKIFTDILEQQVSGMNSVSQSVKNWYLLEQRFYDNDKPMVQYAIMAEEGLVNSRTFPQPTEMKGMEWKYLPDEVKDAFKASYGDVKLNQKIPLNFKDLGAWLIKNTAGSQTIPDIRFGESQLVAAVPLLLTYDKMYTDMINDQYIAKGKIFIPKSMNPNNSQADGLDNTVVIKVPYSNLDIKPEAIQFDSRIEMWEKGLNMILQRIADAVGLSVSALSSALSAQPSQTSKTAKEIAVESDKTSNTISSKRSLAVPIINEIIQCVLNYYGQEGKVNIRFSKSGLTNQDNLVIQTIRKWREGLISPEQALKDLHPDWNQNEIDSELELIQQYEQKKLKMKMEYRFQDKKEDFSIIDEQLTESEIEEKEKIFAESSDEELGKESFSDTENKKLT